jgi:hypothetical protein
VGVRIPTRAAILAVLVGCAVSAAAQDSPAPPPKGEAKPAASAYGLGDQTLSISLGPLVPLFYLAPGGSTATANLTLGGGGSLAWMAYLTGAVKVGVEIGGEFAFSRPNLNLLLMMPILVRAEYAFTIYPFEVPLSLAAGMNIVKYGDLRNIDLLFKPGAGVLYIYDSKWSFGLNLAWWVDLQFYPTDPSQARVGNFLEVSFSALYHFQ